jgi:hypothetical protein
MKTLLQITRVFHSVYTQYIDILTTSGICIIYNNLLQVSTTQVAIIGEAIQKII